MSDLLVLAGGGQVYAPDALADWTQSAESGGTLHLLSMPFAPAGQAGDVVFCRLYLTIVHEDGVQITATPVVDGRTVTEARRYLSRQGRDRSSFILAMRERGSEIQVEIEATAPRSTWHIEECEVSFMPALYTKRED